ncbi:hypothetical protein K493DRAFT_317276 [Basidiobolus meristosporus CBS 931.73]|uniref:MARVEL domain-containing protein n=1 Tax=Basidiobolus meristosporus CBS 931.73 TaxID=1314790 RepID=A0A1Y1Y0C0_9FUNG|nr:hypothetical protein K493DRAFT_317276 [Basidiobolus meristosporus CBS 931.73]|eukprot:ORX91451.1 hypothetical protein K493DRAFT_317276 [Basidiobolus meristosporus CBS 931.73]
MAMLNVRVPAINSCCFCINLRTATLLLAALGMFSHLYSALVIRQMPTTQGSFFYTLWIVYSYLSIVLCGAGAFGVYKNKSKLVKMFALYYWVDLAFGFFLSILFSVKAFHLEDSVCQELGNDANGRINLETCHQFYNNAALAVLVALGLSLVIRLHYSLAVWSFYRQSTTTRYAHVEGSQDTDKLYEMDFE